MADVIDATNDRIQAELDAAIAACVGGVPLNESALYCEECDSEIPESRRAAVKGCRFCVHCQGMYETSQKRYGAR